MDGRDFPWELNTDGFDPDNSSNITIQNGFISCNDDAIAVKLKKGEPQHMEGVFFRDNVIWTVKSALKIGTEVRQRRMTNIVFENNDVVHADRGIVVYCDHGAMIDSPRWVNNHFETIGDNLKQRNIDIRVKDVGGRGTICNILIKDNTFERFSPNRSRLQGLDDSHAIDGVTFDNLVIAGQKRHSLRDAAIDANDHVRNVTFR